MSDGSRGPEKSNFEDLGPATAYVVWMIQQTINARKNDVFMVVKLPARFEVALNGKSQGTFNP
jgi:hypothetical protein